MNRRNFVVSASRISIAGLAAASGALVASESKGHGEAKGHGDGKGEAKAEAKGHDAKPADKGHGEKPKAAEGHGEKPKAAEGHGEKPKAAEGHGTEKAKSADAHAPAKAAEAKDAHPNPAAGHAPAKAAPKPASAAAKPTPKPRAARPAAPAGSKNGDAALAAMRPHSAQEVFDELKAGNKRFVTSQVRNSNTSNARMRQAAREGQRPYAVLLTCADSSAPPELIFDQGVGDIYTVRVAGNVANRDQIASVEYAVQSFDAPLVVVMGHTGCSTVKAVVDGSLLPPEFTQLVRNIKSAFSRTRYGAPGLSGRPLLNAVVQMNVWESIESMLKNSAALRDRVRGGELKIIGANYQIDTGEVTWMGAHPDQCDFV